METKSNHILVGAVTLILLALVAGFTVWLTRYSDGKKKEYDIFFQQSVSGLAKGSAVSFSGVQVGQVQRIELWGPDPDFVRVRISINKNVPILQGTSATINGIGFTGVSDIQLDGAVKGAPPITCPLIKPKSACPAGRPIIPTKPGPLGELLNSAPLLLERLSTLTERLTNILSDKNQASIEKILTNVEGLSGSLAAQAPELQTAIAESRNALAKAGAAADLFGAMSINATALLNDQGKPAIADLRTTMAAAAKSMAALENTMNSTGPAVETLTTQTLPEFNQLARDLRDLSGSLKSITEKLDQQGASGLIGAPALPDYEPAKGKRK
jgi:phospholipid/cholesterol/gamma-HCH transport system substrate-binding protein